MTRSVGLESQRVEDCVGIEFIDYFIEKYWSESCVHFVVVQRNVPVAKGWWREQELRLDIQVHDGMCSNQTSPGV